MVGLIWNPERLFVYSRYKEKIKVMEPPKEYIITTFSLSEEEWMQVANSWFEIKVPKSKRGRKPKPKQITDTSVEMKASL